MALKDELESYSAVDLEFAKRSTVLWDIVASYYTRQINAVNVLGKDLLRFAEKEVKQSNSWKCETTGVLDEYFPRFDKHGGEYSEFPQYQSFNYDVHVRTKSKARKRGFHFWVYADVDGFGWYGGQWGSSKSEELFDLAFYERIKTSLKFPKDVNAEAEIRFPDSALEDDYERQSKYIHIWWSVDSSLSKEKLIALHGVAKRDVFTQMFTALRKRHLF